MEALASNGFMVIAIDHTYAAATVRFPDDEIIEYDPAALPDPEEVGEEAFLESSQTLIEVLTADVKTVVDALEEGENGPFGALATSADVTRLGIFGHTTGGGAAMSFCLQDERCDALLGLDPGVEAIPDRVIAVSAAKPGLYLRSDEWRDTENDAILRGIAERSTVVTYWIGVEGALQSDFEMTPLLSPFAGRLGWTGPIPAGTVIPIVDRYLLGFFDVFLLETGTAALDTASFNEVSVEVIHPDQ
jgi:hypothetical protein